MKKAFYTLLFILMPTLTLATPPTVSPESQTAELGWDYANNNYNLSYVDINGLQHTTTPDALGAPSTSFTRPANTTAYVAGYLVANSTTAGNVVAPSWTTLVRAAGDCYRIERIRMTVSSASITNGQFRIYVFNTQPTVTVGDGANFDTLGALSGNSVMSMAGALNVTLSYSGSDGAVGWATPSNGSSVTACPSSGTAEYALIEAEGSWTPPSGSVISLYVEGYKP